MEKIIIASFLEIIKIIKSQSDKFMSHLGMDLSHLCGIILSHSEKRKRNETNIF